MSKIPSANSEPRFGLRVGTLLGLIALMAFGFWGFREYFSPLRVWRRAIHDPSRMARAWAEVVREHVIEGLDPPETLAEVVEALKDADPANRGLAVSTLPTLDADPVVVIDRLAGMLGDTETSVRIKTAEALGQVYKRGSTGRAEALGALEIALKDPDANLRKAALGSIGQVIFESGKSVDPLRSGQSDDPSLEMVARRLSDENIDVRVEAAFVLGCNDRGNEAVPMLVKFIREQPIDKPFNHVADRAFMALTILSIRSPAAVSFLAGELGVDRESYPDRPRDALAWAARQSSDAHLAVRKKARDGLKSKNPVIRFQSAFLMHDIGMGVEVIETLVEALQDEEIETRIRAIEAIADVGEADPRAMNALQAASNDPDLEIRARALSALEEIASEKMF
jgi:HEAT repeat protein